MANICFQLAEDQVSVELHINDFSLPIPTEEELKFHFKISEFGQCLFLDDVLPQVMNAFPKVKSENDEVVPLEEPLVFIIAKKLDASLEINVASDLLQASVHLVTAHGGDNFTTQAMLNHLIEELATELPEGFANQIRQTRAVKGLKKDVIEQICSESLYSAPGTKFNEIIAEGLPPEEGTPTIFEYLVTPLQDRELVPKKNDDGSVDMYELGEIEVVDIGDKLVKRISSKAGANGFNIAGEVLHSIAPKNLSFSIGEGAEVCEDDPDLLVATQEGVPIRIENGMLVSKVLTLDRVDLSVGNIDFDGTVIVEGDVAPELCIKATQDVLINGFAESCTIEAEGNITVLQGVIGQKGISNTKQIDLTKITTRLIAGKDINVHLAQAAYLEAKNDVIVAVQLLHCHTIAGESVQVGKKGEKLPKLIGGKVHAAHVAAGEIGAPSNSRIVIDLSKKIRALQKQIHDLIQPKIDNDERMEKIERLYRKLSVSDSTPELEVQREKIKNTIDQIAAARKKMEEKESAMESEIEAIRNEIHIDVYGEIYPGVEFIICHEKYRTISHIPACTVRFCDDQIRYDRAQVEPEG